MVRAHPKADPDSMAPRTGLGCSGQILDSPRQGSLANLLSCHTTRCGVNWGLRPQDTRAARRNNQSLRNAPMLHIHRGVLSESTYRDEDPERATQPEAVSVVRRRTVPWTYCRSTTTRDLTVGEFIRYRFRSRAGYDSTAHPEMAL